MDVIDLPLAQSANEHEPFKQITAMVIKVKPTKNPTTNLTE